MLEGECAVCGFRGDLRVTGEVDADRCEVVCPFGHSTWEWMNVD